MKVVTFRSGACCPDLAEDAPVIFQAVVCRHAVDLSAGRRGRFHPGVAGEVGHLITRIVPRPAENR